MNEREDELEKIINIEIGYENIFEGKCLFYNSSGIKTGG
jgi:hypothetical protein